jgi:hypothetical protein
LTRKLLDLAGIGKERLNLAWVSSAEAQRFVEVVTGFTDSIKSLGKLDYPSYELEIEASLKTLDGEFLRWTVGKEVKITTQGDVYGREWETKRFEVVLDSVLEREYQKNLIYQAIQEGFTSVRDISGKIGLELKRISFLLADMEKTGMVEFTGMEDKKPVFATV